MKMMDMKHTAYKTFFVLIIMLCTDMCTYRDDSICEPMENYFVYCNPLFDSVSIHISPDSSSEVIGSITNESLPYCGVDYSYNWCEVVYQGKMAYVERDSSIIICGSYHTIQPVYYVSIGGGLSLEEVNQRQIELCYRDLESPIFVTIDKDLIVYRICPYCSYDMAEAKAIAQWYNSIGVEAFVWESIGQAKCIEQPSGLSCMPIIVSPDY